MVPDLFPISRKRVDAGERGAMLVVAGKIFPLQGSGEVFTFLIGVFLREGS